MDLLELIDITGTYTVRKHKINLLSQRNRAENLTKDSLFYLFLKLVQINYIFSIVIC